MSFIMCWCSGIFFDYKNYAIVCEPVSQEAPESSPGTHFTKATLYSLPAASDQPGGSKELPKYTL